MGFSASIIIIHQPVPVDHQTLLEAIGFSNLTKIEDQVFEAAMDPDDKEVYIGTYKDNLIVCAPTLPIQFFEDYVTPVEKTLYGLFPEAEICTFILHTIGNFWSYSVTIKSEKRRIRVGSEEDGTCEAFGEPLEEELDLLSQSRIDEHGNRLYVLRDFPGGPFGEHLVGENFVFAICKRYFGEELDQAEDLLYRTTLSGYGYEKLTIVKADKPQ